MIKLKSTWCIILQQTAKGGFSMQNAPKNKEDKSIPEEEIDWSYKLSNEAIIKVTDTKMVNYLM